MDERRHRRKRPNSSSMSSRPPRSPSQNFTKPQPQPKPRHVLTGIRSVSRISSSFLTRKTSDYVTARGGKYAAGQQSDSTVQAATTPYQAPKAKTKSRRQREQPRPRLHVRPTSPSPLTRHKQEQNRLHLARRLVQTRRLTLLFPRKTTSHFSHLIRIQTSALLTSRIHGRTRTSFHPERQRLA